MAAKKLPITKASQPHYKRWMSMIQRCYNLSSRSSKERRRLNICVETVWHHENPEGYKNYETWLDKKIQEHPEFSKTEFRVALIDVTKHFGPNNCKLTTHCAIARERSTNVLTKELVIEMRRAKRADPYMLLETLVEKYEVSGASISRSLRGLSWANANSEEPPLKKKEFENHKPNKIAYIGNDRNQLQGVL